MVRLYCLHYEGHEQLCPRCRALIDYAHQRLDHCPSGNGKGSCRRCPIHCYRPDMRSLMRQVMRYSGPRMLLRHPWATLRQYDAMWNLLRKLKITFPQAQIVGHRDFPTTTRS